MVHETLDDRQARPADGLVSELAVVAGAIGIDEAALVAALGEGQTIGQVARAHRVKPRRVVKALVSQAVVDMAADIQGGDLTADQVRWLVALATWRAEDLVTSTFPPIEFRPGALAAH